MILCSTLPRLTRGQRGFRGRVRYEGFSVGEGDVAVSDDEFAQRIERQVTTWPEGRVHYEWHKCESFLAIRPLNASTHEEP